MNVVDDTEYDTIVRVRAFRDGAQMPEATTELAAGRDVRAWIMNSDAHDGRSIPASVTIEPGDSVPISTGLNIRLEPLWECLVRREADWH